MNLWSDMPVEELAEGLCLMFGAESDAERAGVMPICITLATGLKTLTADDSRTAPIIDLLRQLTESDSEGVEIGQALRRGSHQSGCRRWNGSRWPNRYIGFRAFQPAQCGSASAAACLSVRRS
jgi:hypothetical protein